MELTTDIDVATNDLGPLAWVLDELRKSLDSASAALRRFVRDTGLARGSDMASVDGGQLLMSHGVLGPWSQPTGRSWRSSTCPSPGSRGRAK